MRAMTEARLKSENRQFRGTGGVSGGSGGVGFRPAFMDAVTRAIYPSRFADGRPAPFHLLDGLPDEVVLRRDGSGRVAAVKASILSGFVRSGRFYTRDEAASLVAACA